MLRKTNRKFKKMQDLKSENFKTFLGESKGKLKLLFGTDENDLNKKDLNQPVNMTTNKLNTSTSLKAVVSGEVSTIINSPISNNSKIPFVLDQGGEGTCVANAMAYAVYVSLGNIQNRPVNNINMSENILSRCCLQFLENMTISGFNPGFIVNNPILTPVLDTHQNYMALYDAGSWFSIASSAMFSTNLPSESVWTYPQSYEISIPNYYSPLKNSNPLLTEPYIPSTNGKFTLTSVTCHTINYGSKTYTPQQKDFENHYLNPTIWSNLNDMFARETTLLINDSNTNARQRAFITTVNSRLRSGNCLLMSFYVERQFINTGSDGLYIPSTTNISPSAIIGGHACTIIGIMSGTQWRTKFPSSTKLSRVVASDYLFEIKNSWGSSWGDNGTWYVKITDFINTRINQSIAGYTTTLFTPSCFEIVASLV